LSALEEGDGMIQVIASDMGMGIAPEHLPHIFERFYRVDKSRSEPGTGLGLSIAAEIARAHGGRIEVKSVVGQGTTFIVFLPQKKGSGLAITHFHS
ncbi:MAG: sensor histidine kinase, partial [bacterium]